MTKRWRIGRGRAGRAGSIQGAGLEVRRGAGGSADTPPRPRPPPRLFPPPSCSPRSERAGARRWRRRTIICSSCCSSATPASARPASCSVSQRTPSTPPSSPPSVREQPRPGTGAETRGADAQGPGRGHARAWRPGRETLGAAERSVRAGRDRARGADGDAGLRTEEREPEQSGTRGVGDRRGLPGGGGGGPRGTESRGNTGNCTEREKEGRVDTNMD